MTDSMPSRTAGQMADMLGQVAAELDALGVVPRQLQWCAGTVTVQVAAADLDRVGDRLHLPPTVIEGSLAHRRGWRWPYDVRVNVYCAAHDYQALPEVCEHCGQPTVTG